MADLLTELRIEGIRDSLIEEIVDVANQFGIVTPYTAYLAEEPDRPSGEDFAADAVALESPRPGGRTRLAARRPSASRAPGRAARRRHRFERHWRCAWWAPTRTTRSTSLDREKATRPTSEAPEVEVGSDEFLELIARDPSIADAAALGERVIALGPDGWITIVWPDAETAG